MISPRASSSWDWKNSSEYPAALAAKVQTEGVILEQDAISRIEKGTRMVQDYELWAMAAVLGVTSDWLMAGAENE